MSYSISSYDECMFCLAHVCKNCILDLFYRNDLFLLCRNSRHVIFPCRSLDVCPYCSHCILLNQSFCFYLCLCFCLKYMFLNVGLFCRNDLFLLCHNFHLLNYSVKLMNFYFPSYFLYFLCYFFPVLRQSLKIPRVQAIKPYS
ncbi:hypothetical protein M900_A0253 [Bacteriovorax sp. Seq25_V]|nr:hypothetical protein M900_A0253 [Bacteriovorax sp. Seq25_V]